jgi:hypothetical protein
MRQRVFVYWNHLLHRRRRRMKNILFIFVLAAAVLAGACASGGGGSASTGRAIKSGPVGNNLTATISSPTGVLKNGKQELTLTFADASGKPVDVGSASLNFFMPAMGSMAAMNDPATLTTTSTPGVYAAKVDIEMAGEWQAQVKYEGPAGKGSGNIAMTAQ